jgi:glucose dehydrogenase
MFTAAWARIDSYVTEVIGAAAVMLGRLMRLPVTMMSPVPASPAPSSCAVAVLAGVVSCAIAGTANMPAKQVVLSNNRFKRDIR